MNEWEYKIYYFDWCVLKKMPEFSDKLFNSLEEAKEFLKNGYSNWVQQRVLPFKQIVICSRSKVCNTWMIDKVINP